jgi:hypothetical protein
MICKHVDILAIAALLLGLALLSKARYTAPYVIFHKGTVVEPFHRPLVVLPEPPYVRLTVD